MKTKYTKLEKESSGFTRRGGVIMKNKCKLCGWTWVPRKKESKACPNCKRYDWKEKKVKQ